MGMLVGGSGVVLCKVLVGGTCVGGTCIAVAWMSGGGLGSAIIGTVPSWEAGGTMPISGWPMYGIELLIIGSQCNILLRVSSFFFFGTVLCIYAVPLWCPMLLCACWPNCLCYYVPSDSCFLALAMLRAVLCCHVLAARPVLLNAGPAMCCCVCWPLLLSVGRAMCCCVCVSLCCFVLAVVCTAVCLLAHAA